MKVWCKRCNNPEEVPEERAKKIQKIPDWSSKFTYTPCWQKAQEPASNDKQEQIAYAQSWNLAAKMITEEMKMWPMSKLDASLQAWQEYFYSKLTNRN